MEHEFFSARVYSCMRVEYRGRSIFRFRDPRRDENRTADRLLLPLSILASRIEFFSINPLRTGAGFTRFRPTAG